ncbi:MAG: Gfo/Idh/MocA family oxidoreductase [candidate division WOR-3 bacterium]
MMKTKSIGIGVIGIGYWGKNILRNLYELGVVSKACDADLKTIEERKKEFPNLEYTENVEVILNDNKITAVAIATPSATHYQLVKKALNAGKDVFVEKPLALNFNHGKELVDLAKKKNKILMVGHILQYHPAVIKLKELIDQGVLGKIQYIYSNRLNIGKLRIEENILWSFAPHDISIILMLIGSEPIKISCFGEGYLNKDIFDVTLTTLEFDNDIKSHIFVSWLHPFKEQKLVVVGSKAMAVFDDLTKEKLFVYPHKIEWTKGKIPVAHKAEYYCVNFEYKEPLKEEMKHFIECLSKRSNPKTDGEEGLSVLKVLEHAEKSLKDRGQILSMWEDKKYFVHPSALIDNNVEIGEGTKIWHFSHILSGTKIGKNCVIGQNVMIGPDVKIGNKCKIQNNVSIYKAVTLEDEVFCGPSCVFTNVYNPRAFVERKDEFLPTLVKKGASIGANATIVCGNTIGKYAFVGAGAVVKKDVPDYALVVGVPARQIGWVCKCGVPLKNFDKNKKTTCKNCGSQYSLKKDTLVIIKETL